MNSTYEYRNLPWRDSASIQVKSGQVLMRIEWDRESRLDLYSWEGSKLPAYLILVVFKIVLGQGWIEKLEELHRLRQDMWKVEIYCHPDEVKEYRLYKLDHNNPVCSSAITICQGLINTFSIRTEDTAPLLKRIIEDFPPVLMPLLRNKRYTYFFPTHFPGFARNRCFKEVPAPIMAAREETVMVKVNENNFLSDVFQPGDTSGIIETIEALKCLEVLLA